MIRAGGWLRRLLPSTRNSHSRQDARLPPVRLRAFWAVQLLTFAIAFVHTVLARLGFPAALYLVPTSLFFVPVAYAALKFGVRGAVPTAIWSSVLTLPDLVLFHGSLDQIGILWQGVILVAIGAFVGQAVDLERAARTDAEAREAARLASERRFRALYDRAADAVLVVDDAGRIGEANAAATRLIGRDLAEVRGRQLTEVVGDDLAADLLSAVGNREPRQLHADTRSSPVWVQPVGTSPLTGPGEGGGLQVMFRDVTLQYERERGLEGYARHAESAREEERRRLAHELHDGPLQSLVLLLRKLDALDESVDDDGILDDARQIVDETAAELRRLSRALRPPILDDLGLAAAVRSETTAFERRSGIEAQFEVAGRIRVLPPDTELLLLRAAQESLHNVERHSGAAAVRVSLTYEPGCATLNVADDGRGIGRVPTPTALLADGKLGLLGIQERVRLAKGILEIGARPGGGTAIMVRVPTLDS